MTLDEFKLSDWLTTSFQKLYSSDPKWVRWGAFAWLEPSMSLIGLNTGVRGKGVPPLVIEKRKERKKRPVIGAARGIQPGFSYEN